MAVPGLAVPEWRGHVSSKFGDIVTSNTLSRRIIDTGCRTGNGLAARGMDTFFQDTHGLAASEGRRHIETTPAEVNNWRPARRSLSEPGYCHYEKAEGKRQVEGAPSQPPKTLAEKRHVRQIESKEEYGDRPYGPKTITRDNGLRAADQPAREVDISLELARKTRPLALRDQRNGLGVKSLGDKNYRHPEYDNNFFKIGGLVVGSTFQRGHFKKTEPKNNASVQLVAPTSSMGGRKLNYKERREEELRQRVNEEVEDLHRQWEHKTLKNFMEDDTRRWYTRKLGFEDKHSGSVEKEESDSD